MRAICAAIAIAIIIAPTPCLGADNENTRATLAGLSEFVVAVGVSDAFQKIGLDSLEIRTEVELKLRQAGIRVVPPTAKYSGPSLVVNVSGTGDVSRLCFFLEVGVRQWVRLVGPEFTRKKDKVYERIDTWTWNRVGGVTSDNAGVALVRGTVREGVDAFLNAYLAANPKPGSGPREGE